MPTADAGFCTECGKPATAADLFQFAGRSVCPDCKPAFAQRLRQEGLRPTTLQGVEYGGFWIRFAARMIDGIIVGVAALAVNAVIMVVFRQSAGGTTPLRLMSPIVPSLIFTANILMAAFYEAFFLVRNAATP